MTPKQGEFKKPVRYESPWIIRGQEAIARIGIAPELNAAIFTLTPEAPLGKQVFKVGRAYYVVKLKERETPDLEKFAAEKETLRSQALWSKRAQVFQAYVQNLRDRAEVSLNPALFGAGRDG